jgi:LacI family transcriptional regulator
MQPESHRQLSPQLVRSLLDRANADDNVVVGESEALASEHRCPSGGSGVVAVAMNLDLEQLSLDSDGNPSHPFFDEVLFGMRARAHAGDLHLLLLTSPSETCTGRDVPYLELCRERGLDGIILVSYSPEETGLAEIAQSELACVAIDTHVIGPRSGFVISDNVSGAIEAVRHLASLGRTRIAFIGGCGPERASADRRLGYESALGDLGLESRPDYALHAHWNHGEAHERTRELLALPEPPDAIFCASDRMAIGTLLALEEAGLRVPEDVAVVGFDDSDLARLVTPRLSTVRQDMIGLGAAAVEAMIQILEHPDQAPPTSVLPTELIERESSIGRTAARQRRAVADDGKGSRESAGLDLDEPEELLSPAVVFDHLGETRPLAAEVLERATGSTLGRARAPASDRRVIGLAMITAPHQSFRHAFLDDLYFATRAHAFARGIDLLSFTSLCVEGIYENIPYLELCKRHGAEGIVVISLPHDHPETKALVESDLPCVAIDIDMIGPHSGFVMSDNVDGGMQAVRHLADRGCERIAFLGGHGPERPSIDRRFGYQSELARLGLEQREDYVRMAKWDHHLAYDETRSLLGLEPRPDGIFCSSDVMAIGAIAAIRDAGLRVPEDVAVVGFDDIAFARLLGPSLSTIRQSQLKLAGAAIDALERMIERPDEPPPVSILPVELIVRESSGGRPPTAAERVAASRALAAH